MFKAALYGSGFITQNHIAAIQALEDVQLAAVVARNAETGAQLARENGAAYFSSLEAAKQATDMDIVIICTPTHAHHQHVVEAARLKCHVLCEKPIAMNLEDFDDMVDVCRENGVRFMVAQVLRFAPEYMAIRDQILSGRLGDMHMIYEKRLSQHPAWAKWHRDPALSGGGLWDLNVHDIDYVYSLFGRPESVYASGWKSPSGCWNHVCTSLRWKSGAKAVVETSLEMTGSWPFSVEVRATGDHGTLHYAKASGVNLNDGENSGRLNWYPAGSEEIHTIDVDQTDMFIGQLREFLDSIRENREASVTLEQNREVLEIIQASERSLEENIVVYL